MKPYATTLVISFLLGWITLMSAPGVLPAQDSWTLLKPATPLPGRTSFAMCYDSHRGVVVVFGGRQRSSLNDTWEWSGSNWTQRAPSTTPPAVYGHAMTYDAARKVSVMFGATGSIWEWNGTDWRQIRTTSGPLARSHGQMVYDEVNRVMVLFGGNTSPVPGGTWTWDGQRWTVAATLGPPPRYHHGMVWDSTRRRVVMFGGSLIANGQDFRTWEWDGVRWTIGQASTSPYDYGSAMAHHPDIGRTILTGGVIRTNQTWGYDGVDWRQHNPQGSLKIRAWAEMVFDTKRREIVMIVNPNTFPGPTSIYAYRAKTKTPAKARAFGIACGRSPKPNLRFEMAPYIGYPVSLRLENALPTFFSSAFLYIGDSDQTWQGIRLPLDLSLIGGTGCHLYVSPILLFAMSKAGSQATFTAMIPANVSLVGVNTYAQAIVLDSLANPLGAALSNAVMGTVGQFW